MALQIEQPTNRAILECNEPETLKDLLKGLKIETIPGTTMKGAFYRGHLVQFLTEELSPQMRYKEPDIYTNITNLADLEGAEVTRLFITTFSCATFYYECREISINNPEDIITCKFIYAGDNGYKQPIMEFDGGDVKTIITEFYPEPEFKFNPEEVGTEEVIKEALSMHKMLNMGLHDEGHLQVARKNINGHEVMIRCWYNNPRIVVERV